MNLIAIGDIHGRTSWKEILKKETTADKIIFVGDYFDSRDKSITGEQEIENFLDIVEAKRNDDRITLLLGNHDLHYLIDEQYSGYQIGSALEIRRVLTENISFFQACYIADEFIFSHAGVSKTWADNYEIDFDNLEESINKTFKGNYNTFRFQSGRNFSNTGDDITQGPMWIRPTSLMKSKIENFTHVVGHTSVWKIDTEHEIILIDALEERQYLKVVDGVPSAMLL